MRPPSMALPAAIFARECRLAFRGAAFWTLAGGGALLAFWRAAVPGLSAPSAAYRAAEAIILGLGVFAIFIAAQSAGRDRRQSATQLVLAKPAGSSPSLIVLRFAAVWLSIIALAALMLAAASIAQIAIARTPWRPEPYAHALLRALVPLGLTTALGFSLSTIFATSLASAVAGIYWLVVPLTRDHIAIAFDLALSQHRLVAALLAASLVLLTAALYARHLRDRGRATAGLGWAAALLLAATAGAAYHVATDGDDALLRPDPVLSAISAQTTRTGPRAPGFWLPDARGRLAALSDHTGHPVVLAFWGPAVPDSVLALSLLRDIEAEHGSEAACIAVCVDRDAAAMLPFRPEAGPDVIMLWDRGRHFGEGGYAGDSPLALAYEVTALPAVFVLDRERGLVQSFRQGFGPGRVRAEVARVVEQ